MGGAWTGEGERSGLGLDVGEAAMVVVLGLGVFVRIRIARVVRDLFGNYCRFGMGASAKRQDLSRATRALLHPSKHHKVT